MVTSSPSKFSTAWFQFVELSFGELGFNSLLFSCSYSRLETSVFSKCDVFLSISVLAVQDLVDFEHVDGIEWSQESEDEIDETVEGMDVED